MPRALVIFHEPDRDLGVRNIGTLRPELAARGFDVDAATFDGGGPEPDASGADVVVLMGSPDAAYDDTLPWLKPELEFVKDTAAHGIPTLGVCFGGQLLSRALGGTVTRAAEPEYGFVTIDTDDPDLIAPGPWMQFHYDTFSIPPGAESIARTSAANQAFVSGPHLGIQFHPEIDADVFASWADGWVERGESDAVRRAVDVDAITRDVAHHEQRARQACGTLLDAWLARV